MLSEIDNLTSELRTEKISIRNKAFSKLNDILSSQYDDLKRALSDDSSGDISWEYLFIAVHQGILQQATKLAHDNVEPNENDTKISNYSRVMCNLSDCMKDGKMLLEFSSPVAPLTTFFVLVPPKVLISNAYEVLREEGHRKYFGKCYLQALQKTCFRPKSNLTTVDLQLWKGKLGKNWFSFTSSCLCL
jgi:hypothetical protein